MVHPASWARSPASFARRSQNWTGLIMDSTKRFGQDATKTGQGYSNQTGKMLSENIHKEQVP